MSANVVPLTGRSGARATVGEVYRPRLSIVGFTLWIERPAKRRRRLQQEPQSRRLHA
jgi:hypothetical protein